MIHGQKCTEPVEGHSATVKNMVIKAWGTSSCIVLWEFMVGLRPVLFGSTVGADKRILAGCGIIQMRHPYCLCCSLAFFPLNKAHHFKRWAAQQVELGWAAVCWAVSFQSSRRSKGVRSWAAKQAGPEGSGMRRAVSHWRMSVLGMWDSKLFWTLQIWEPYDWYFHQALHCCPVTCSSICFAFWGRCVIVRILPYYNKHWTPSSSLHYLALWLLESFSSLFIALQKGVLLTLPYFWNWQCAFHTSGNQNKPGRQAMKCFPFTNKVLGSRNTCWKLEIYSFPAEYSFQGTNCHHLNSQCIFVLDNSLSGAQSCSCCPGRNEQIWKLFSLL